MYDLFTDTLVLNLDESEPLYDKHQAKDLIRKLTDTENYYAEINWEIEYSESTRLIGIPGFNNNWNRHSLHTELGGIISSKNMKRGFGSEVIQALIYYEKEKMALNKIYSLTNSRNKAAITS